MARHRKTEPSVTVSAAGAAPARRKTATLPQKPRPSAVIEADAVIAEPVAVRFSPTQEKIAELAYSYWVTRGYQGGCPQEDWLRAEQELLQQAPTVA
jgi:hypothetical protein